MLEHQSKKKIFKINWLQVPGKNWCQHYKTFFSLLFTLDQNKLECMALAIIFERKA
jgi:hypothetical protein